jgi:hypothetical protein
MDLREFVAMSAPIVREDVYRMYWAFAEERQRVFQARLAGAHAPWTEDPILHSYRFCNAFRAADRVSQHLIQHAAFGDPSADADDLFLRVVLHRLFCRPTTWDLLEASLGNIEARTFNAEDYDAVLEAALERGQRLYTSAFILCATPAYGFSRKHRNHLALLAAMLKDGVPDRISQAPSLESVYIELRAWPLLGPFMAYQLAIDLNYSPLIEFSEDAFVVAGPGADRGLAKVFVDLNSLTPSQAIAWLVEQQHVVEDELGICPPTLFGRPLHAIDCQNLLCEVDKYCREAVPGLESNLTRIKQRFAAGSSSYDLFFPPEWGINDKIPEGRRRDVGDPAPL